MRLAKPIWLAALALIASSAAFAQALPDEKAVASLFAQRCAGCHGEDGTGPRPKRPHVDIPNLRTAEWRASHSTEQTRDIIANGVPAKHMPAFKSRLTAGDIQALASYVQSFR